MTTSIPSSPPQRLPRVWDWLTRPHPAIHSSDDRRRARLLSALLFPLIFLPLIAMLIRALADQSFEASPVSVGGILFVAIAYGISRTAHYRWAARLALSVFPIAIPLIALVTYNSADFKILMAYQAFALVLSSMLLSIWDTIILAIVSLISVAVLPVLSPVISFPITISPLTFLGEISALLILSIRHRDLLEQDRQTALAEREERYRSLFNGVTIGLYRSTPSGQILDTNPAMRAMLGYPDQEALAAINAHDLYVDAGERQRLAALVDSEDRAREFEVQVKRMDGTIIWIRDTMRAVRDASGQILRYEGSVEDISERKQAQAELERYREHLEELVEQRTVDLKAANDRLVVLGRVKDEFVSNVSHELRTPITSLKLYEHLLGQHNGDSKDYLGAMKRETERLEQTIEDLLLLSRLDQRRIELSLSAVDLNELAGQYVSDRQVIAQTKNLLLEFIGQSNLPAARADSQLLSQVLGILLTNAINYTPTGGQVTVRTDTRCKDGLQWVGFSVSDTGPGLTDEDKVHLFERFFRGKVGTGSKMPGTGLGLSIAREIVERHNGQIEAASGGPGTGATFSTWLLASTDLSSRM